MAQNAPETANGKKNQGATLPEKQRKFGTLKSNGDSLYWLERRLQDKGRGVIMCWDEEQGLKEILPAPYAARSKVHEYGGGEFCIGHEGVFFVNSEDQQIYHCSEEGAVTQITKTPDHRYADLEYDSHHHRLIAVVERHHEPTNQDVHPLPDNMLVYIDLKETEAGGLFIIDDQADFYASPRLSKDGATLAWLTWNLPDMPWQSAKLMISPIEPLHMQPSPIKTAKDSAQKNASFGPVWDNDGRLYFVNDVSGYGQLYCWQDNKVEKVNHQDEQADNSQPHWVFGMQSHTVDAGGIIILTGFKAGKLYLQQITDKEICHLKTEAKTATMPHMVNDQLAALITSDESPSSIALINTSTGEVTSIRSSYDEPIDPSTISKATMTCFSGEHGEVYGLYYPPIAMNKQDTLPPAIITIHGGPTAMVERGISDTIHHWTNRGYAVFEVDYSGSSGYGKAYRDRLDGKWGEADVNDIIAAAHHLIDQNWADPERLILTGGSSGGYTALMALVKSDIFKCAACKYPVTDLGQLLKITHKFEAGYIYSLTGTTPDNAEAILQNKAIEQHLDHLTTPVIFFQGLDDKVVPPSQPRAVYQALQTKGVETELFEFPEEGHGFAQASTQNTVLREQERFFNKVLNR